MKVLTNRISCGTHQLDNYSPYRHIAVRAITHRFRRPASIGGLHDGTGDIFRFGPVYALKAASPDNYSLTRGGKTVL